MNHDPKESQITCKSKEFNQWYDDLLFTKVIADILFLKGGDLPMLSPPMLGRNKETTCILSVSCDVFQKWEDFLLKNGYKKRPEPYGPIIWDSIAFPEYRAKVVNYCDDTNHDCTLGLWVYSPIAEVDE